MRTTYHRVVDEKSLQEDGSGVALREDQGKNPVI